MTTYRSATSARTLADQLLFPEGPVSMDDGSVIIGEIFRGTVTRVSGGERQIVANVGGGPNGLAVGPDGHLYVCNNGGITHIVQDGTADALLSALPMPPSQPIKPCVQRVNLRTGVVESLFNRHDDWDFEAPNDIVFDELGGFYFTDSCRRLARSTTKGRIFYVPPGADEVQLVHGPIDTPNGIGLSPDGKVLYVSQTDSARLWAFDLQAPGYISDSAGRMIYNVPGFRWFDSLAIEANGNICVGALWPGAVLVVSPTGSLVEEIGFEDPVVTNLCFDRRDPSTAYITCSATGVLVEMPWARRGLVTWF